MKKSLNPTAVRRTHDAIKEAISDCVFALVAMVGTILLPVMLEGVVVNAPGGPLWGIAKLASNPTTQVLHAGAVLCGCILLGLSMVRLGRIALERYRNGSPQPQ